MNTVILSDLHIGSRYFISEPLKGFLENLLPQTDLVLNGDSVDRRRFKVLPQHRSALDLLVKESYKRRVIWIWGNHDWKYMPPDSGQIEFLKSYNIGKRLYVSHGHKFDLILLLLRPLTNIIRIIYDRRAELGNNQVHVASAAKKFEWLYGVLRKHVAAGAVNFARKNGYEAVACGHTHYVEDFVMNGVRYINTGAWTEFPITCISVGSEKIELKTIYKN